MLLRPSDQELSMLLSLDYLGQLTITDLAYLIDVDKRTIRRRLTESPDGLLPKGWVERIDRGTFNTSTGTPTRRESFWRLTPKGRAQIQTHAQAAVAAVSYDEQYPAKPTMPRSRTIEHDHLVAQTVIAMVCAARRQYGLAAVFVRFEMKLNPFANAPFADAFLIIHKSDQASAHPIPWSRDFPTCTEDTALFAIEADNDTEPLSTIQRKAVNYANMLDDPRWQKQWRQIHRVVPRIVWVAPNQDRLRAIAQTWFDVWPTGMWLMTHTEHLQTPNKTAWWSYMGKPPIQNATLFAKPYAQPKLPAPAAAPPPPAALPVPAASPPPPASEATATPSVVPPVAPGSISAPAHAAPMRQPTRLLTAQASRAQVSSPTAMATIKAAESVRLTPSPATSTAQTLPYPNETWFAKIDALLAKRQSRECTCTVIVVDPQWKQASPQDRIRILVWGDDRRLLRVIPTRIGKPTTITCTIPASVHRVTLAVAETGTVLGDFPCTDDCVTMTLPRERTALAMQKSVAWSFQVARYQVAHPWWLEPPLTGVIDALAEFINETLLMIKQQTDKRWKRGGISSGIGIAILSGLGISIPAALLFIISMTSYVLAPLVAVLWGLHAIIWMIDTVMRCSEPSIPWPHRLSARLLVGLGGVWVVLIFGFALWDRFVAPLI